jgi:hypothetical protein
MIEEPFFGAPQAGHFTWNTLPSVGFPWLCFFVITHINLLMMTHVKVELSRNLLHSLKFGLRFSHALGAKEISSFEVYLLDKFGNVEIGR